MYSFSTALRKLRLSKVNVLGHRSHTQYPYPVHSQIFMANGATAPAPRPVRECNGSKLIKCLCRGYDPCTSGSPTDVSSIRQRLATAAAPPWEALKQPHHQPVFQAFWCQASQISPDKGHPEDNREMAEVTVKPEPAQVPGCLPGRPQ